MNAAKSLAHAIVILGPAGCGKTTVGRKLAADFGHRFIDADDHHSAANIKKMTAGLGLSDDDRAPWLRELRALLEKEQPSVLACSALKGSYRTVLGGERGDVVFVYLKVPAEQLQERLSSRAGHYAGVALLEGQLAALEEPDESEPDVLTIDAVGTEEEVLLRVKELLSENARCD